MSVALSADGRRAATSGADNLIKVWDLRTGREVRTFAKHLVLTEPRTQIPPRHVLGPAHRRRSPHLYSWAEVQHLLRRAGQLQGRLQPHTWQTLIVLLASSGLRISEALHLKVSDVDGKRHTMASRVLQRWQAGRKGAVNRILILSRFLGHSDVEDTYWYLTALPQLLAEAAQRFALNEPENS